MIFDYCQNVCEQIKQKDEKKNQCYIAISRGSLFPLLNQFLP